MAALMDDQWGSNWRWGRGRRLGAAEEEGIVRVERRDSLKLRVKLERAKLVRALVVKVAAEVQLVKLKSISESDWKRACSSVSMAVGL